MTLFLNNEHAFQLNKFKYKKLLIKNTSLHTHVLQSFNASYPMGNVKTALIIKQNTLIEET